MFSLAMNGSKVRPESRWGLFHAVDKSSHAVGVGTGTTVVYMYSMDPMYGTYSITEQASQQLVLAVPLREKGPNVLYRSGYRLVTLSVLYFERLPVWVALSAFSNGAGRVALSAFSNGAGRVALSVSSAFSNNDDRANLVALPVHL